MTIIICLVGTHYRRAFDGIRYWSKIHGITKLNLLYSEPRVEYDPPVLRARLPKTEIRNEYYLNIYA